MKFPDGFIWGTACSAHQIEGNDTNCDWWEWEKSKGEEGRQLPLEPSGIACDFYNRYPEDLELCRQLNSNGLRMSLAWNRIEPSRGKFDKEEIEHYRKVLHLAKKKGLKVFLTLQHFTLPLWFSAIGGWTNLKSPEIFANFVKKCAREYEGLVDVYFTINEPQVYALLAYTNGMWPPNKKSYPLSLLVQLNLMRAHILAYRQIKLVSKASVGVNKNIVWYEPHPSEASFLDRWAAKFLFYLNCEFFINPVRKYLDVIGLNYYFTTRLKDLKVKNLDDVISDLGWWVNSEGLEKILLHLKKFKIPIYITENGIADAKDSLRKKFISDMLVSCYKAISKGVDLRGYFYWSLMDNYEWHQGFWPKFGLVEIDFKNKLERKPRASFYYYANISKYNQIDPKK
jgi:beta-glucosidase